MALIYILLSVSCSLLIAHLLKETESRKLRTPQVLTVNYLAAFVTAFAVRMENTLNQLHLLTAGIWVFAGFVGLFFIANFVIYSKSVDGNGVGVSVAAMRLSLLIPVLVSIIGYGEHISWWKGLGITLVFLALFLLLPRKQKIMEHAIRYRGMLIMLFLFTGLTDAALKVFQEDMLSNINESFFMGLVFLSAFVVGVVYVIFSGGAVMKRKELLMGLIIGIPNLYSSIFLIRALGYVDGAVAFTAVNILNVTGGTLLGKLKWKDHLTPLQWTGIGTALAAIILLI